MFDPFSAILVVVQVADADADSHRENYALYDRTDTEYKFCDSELIKIVSYV